MGCGHYIRSGGPSYTLWGGGGGAKYTLWAPHYLRLGGSTIYTLRGVHHIRLGGPLYILRSRRILIGTHYTDSLGLTKYDLGGLLYTLRGTYYMYLGSLLYTWEEGGTVHAWGGLLYTLRVAYTIYIWGRKRERENLSVRCIGDFVLGALKRRGNTDELDQLKD